MFEHISEIHCSLKLFNSNLILNSALKFLYSHFIDETTEAWGYSLIYAPLMETFQTKGHMWKCEVKEMWWEWYMTNPCLVYKHGRKMDWAEAMRWEGWCMWDFSGNVKDLGHQSLWFENITLVTQHNCLEEMSGWKDARILQMFWEMMMMEMMRRRIMTVILKIIIVMGILWTPKRESSFVGDLIGRVIEISYRLPRRLMMREWRVSGWLPGFQNCSTVWKLAEGTAAATAK